MADPRGTLLTSEDQQLAAELMASIDVRTLGGSGDAVDRNHLPQRERDDIDPGTLMSTVHSGSYIPGEETGAAPASADFTDLEYDRIGADSGEDGAAEQPEVVFSDRTQNGGPIEDPGDGGGHARGVPERRSVADRDDAMPPEDGTGEEPDGADGANAGVSVRTSDGETFVDDSTIETAGVAAADNFESDGPALPRTGQIDGENEFVIEQVQPNFANAPLLGTSEASGGEDSAIDLDITAALTDPSETLSITISGVPAGATLSAGDDNGDGTWTLTQTQLSGLTLTPPADSDADFSLTVIASSTSDIDTASTVQTFDITVEAVADAPALTVSDASGNEDSAIALDISAALTDTDGSETLSVTVSGVPEGARLSAGTDNGDGTWTLTQTQLSGLTLTPPADSDADFTLTVTSTSTEANGGDTAQTIDTSNVTVHAVADAPTVTANDVSGNEDSAIAFDVTSALTDTDGSETLSVVVSDMPTGASLSAGTDNGDGTWTLDPGDLAGLAVTPPAGSSDDFSLTVTSTSTESENGDTAQSVATFDVTVTADAVETIDGDQNANKNDQLYGGDGEDLIHGHSMNDQLFGGDGDDTLYGDGGNDVLRGEAGHDTLNGGTGNDQLFGGDGNDTLSMGAGNDMAHGGDGSDMLIFAAGEGSNNNFHGGDGGGWIDTIQLQDAAGGAPGEGWVLDLTSGEQVSSGAGFLDLSQDSSGSITMEDGSVLTFDGVEKFTW